LEPTIRKTRTLKVTEIKLTEEELTDIALLFTDPRYQSLLNVMERACISIDTAHLDTPTGEVETVLGGHCVAKAGWLFFQYVQKQVYSAYHTRTQMEEPAEKPSFADLVQGVEGMQGVMNE
jgi:hypothetical protein